ncbi:MAG: GTPase [Planctomycetota bacterium]|nr:GTPase [Planctomycetota bacterium]
MTTTPGADPSPGFDHDGTPIVAIGTAAGHGSRILVRTSGPGCIEALADRLSGDAGEACRARRRGIHLGRWRTAELANPAKPLEIPVLVLLAPGPASFTGEDTIELQVPGHPSLAERLVGETIDELVARLGDARRAGPGEFSARAFLAGHLDLVDATAIAASIAAERDDELEHVDRLRRSGSARDLARLAERVAGSLARLEASIDFTDEEDVVGCTVDELMEGLAPLRSELDRLLDSWRAVGAARSHRARVVLHGPPNAGKSTLFNALVGRERVVAAPTAGTTRDAIEVEIDLGAPGDPDGRTRSITLVDTAGVTTADPPSDRLDASAMGLAREAVERADLVLHCRGVDQTPAPPPDRDGVLSVITKTDQSGSAGAAGADVAGMPEALEVSALTGEGLDRLRNAIADALAARWHGTFAVQALRDLAREARNELNDALDELAGQPGDGPPAHPETTAARCRQAIDAIRRLDGGFDHETVLDLVFGRFCIGK